MNYKLIGGLAAGLLFANVQAANAALVPEANLYAFPSAEGYGKNTVGGRGGKVYEVTNLNDSGTGSLRAAVEAKGARTIVFRVSGTITLNSNLVIKNPNITIAGQTAPGDGITLKKFPLVIAADEVIIRYIRVRLGDESGVVSDAVSGRFIVNVILDHVSASWSIDETMSIYHASNMTIQWSVIAESLYNSYHALNGTTTGETSVHGFGGIWGSNYSSYHHNLIASHSSRNPRFASGSGYTDFRNNVIYNWGGNSSYGGENAQLDNGVVDPDFAFTSINMVNNYYKPGPATQPGKISYRIINPNYRSNKSDYGKWYVAGNFMEGNAAVSADNWKGGVQPQGGDSDLSLIKLSKPWGSMPINEQTATAAYDLVLDNAGATLPRRDAVDTRIISDVRSGVATYEGPTFKTQNKIADASKKTGMIDSQKDVGGWPVLKSTTAPVDTDHDGIPDSWEVENGLDPKKAADGNKLFSDGYTMLEKYLNSIK